MTTLCQARISPHHISRAPPVLRVVRVAAPPRVRHSSHAVPVLLFSQLFLFLYLSCSARVSLRVLGTASLTRSFRHPHSLRQDESSCFCREATRSKFDRSIERIGGSEKNSVEKLLFFYSVPCERLNLISKGKYCVF